MGRIPSNVEALTVFYDDQYKESATHKTEFTFLGTRQTLGGIKLNKVVRGEIRRHLERNTDSDQIMNSGPGRWLAVRRRFWSCRGPKFRS